MNLQNKNKKTYEIQTKYKKYNEIIRNDESTRTSNNSRV